MRLVVCPFCETQYDASSSTEAAFACRCGVLVRNQALPGVDARIVRCGACGAAVGEGAKECEYCGAGITRTGGAKSLICPKCYAGNDERSRFCTGCGLEFRPVPIPAATSVVTCVAGCGPMTTQTVGGVTVHECAQCHGVWIPGNDLDTLVARARDGGGTPNSAATSASRPDFAASFAYRKCPRCSAVMTRSNFRRVSGVVVDRCGAHGTWLDADELERLAAFVAAGGLAKAARYEEEENLRLAKSASHRARLERSTPDRARFHANEAAASPFVHLLKRILD